MVDEQNIAIFGGSFDPPHLGHFAICEWIKNNNIAQKVWVIPCFIHPFDKKISSFEHRLKMCEIAFSNLDYVTVSNVEKKLGGKSITVNTLKFLKDNYDACFKLIVGTDVEGEFSKWTDLESIKKLAEIVIVKRGEHSPIPNISATKIRSMISNNEKFSNFVSKEVENYISENNLYK